MSRKQNNKVLPVMLASVLTIDSSLVPLITHAHVLLSDNEAVMEENTTETTVLEETEQTPEQIESGEDISSITEQEASDLPEEELVESEVTSELTTETATPAIESVEVLEEPTSSSEVLTEELPQQLDTNVAEETPEAVKPSPIVEHISNEIDVFHTDSIAEEKQSQKNVNSFVLGDWTYTDNGTSITLSAYKGSATTLVIPGEYDNKQVILTDVSIFKNTLINLTFTAVNGTKVQLETTSLESGFTYSKYRNLKTIDLSGLDTSRVTTMSNLFENRTITSINLDGIDTSSVVDMSGMFKGASRLTSLTGLTQLNTSKVETMSEMFYNASSLTSLDLSSFDTSNVTNMSGMFRGMSALTSLDISSFNTSKTENMSEMFAWTNLTTLDVSHFNVSNVTDMSGLFFGSDISTLNLTGWVIPAQANLSSAFSYLDNMKHLDLTGWDVSQVTSMEGWFTEASAETIDLSGWDTSSVTDMSQLFYNANNLKSINLEGWDTSNVTNMSKMFYGEKPYMTSLDLSHFNTSKVTDMSYMFYQAGYSSHFDSDTALESINLSGWDTSSVTTMRYMFGRTHALKTLDLSHFDMSNVTDVYNMFSQSGVTSLNLSGWNLENCTDLSGLFSSVGELTHLDVSNWNTSNVTNMSELFYYSSSIASLDLSDWDTSNVTHMDSMFKGTSSLSQLDLSHFDTSNVQSVRGMFSESGVTSLDLSNWDTSSLKSVTDMFFYTTALTSLNLSGWNLENVTSLNNMFASATGLTSLNLSGWNTENVTNLSSMFCGASALTSLDLSGWNTENVTNLSSMFREASGLKTLNLSGWDLRSVTNMTSMFEGATGLTSLDLSGWNTENVTNMSGMFKGATGLTSLDLSGWNTGSVTNMSSMFQGATALRTLNLSGWDLSKVTNIRNMFHSTDSLSIIDLSGWDTSKILATYRTNLFTVSTESPLLVITTDQNLKSYKYATDKRIGVSLGLDANGGVFGNGLTQAEQVGIQFLDDRQVSTINALIQDLITANGGLTHPNPDFMFKSWQKTRSSEVSLEALEQLFNQPNYAQWGVDNAPTITASNKLIHVGDSFNPLDGVSAIDDVDGPIVLNDSNVIFNNVNPSQPGTYQVTYEVADLTGKTATATINVVVNGRPILTVLDQLIHAGDSFNPLDGVTATDHEEGQITLTEANIIFNNVNPSQPGTYQVTYEVTDVHGATDSKTINVVVNGLPVIHAEDLSFTAGDTFNPLDSVSVTDHEDVNISLTEANIIFNNVNPFQPGTYQITYEVTDAHGATVSKTIEVTVLAKEMVILDSVQVTVGDISDLTSFIQSSNTEDAQNTINILSSDFKENTAGTFTVVYESVDSNGVVTPKTLTIVVTPEVASPPVQDGTTPNPDGGAIPDEDSPEIDGTTPDDEVDQPVIDSPIVEDEEVESVKPENNPTINGGNSQEGHPNPDHEEQIETGVSMGFLSVFGGILALIGIQNLRKNKKQN